MRSSVGLIIVCVIAACGGDFSTPGSAAKSFFEACASRDRDRLAECFSAGAEGEFNTIVDKSATDESLAELSEMFRDAEVVEEKIDGDRARVRVSLKWEGRKEETLNMVREQGRWFIRGF